MMPFIYLKYRNKRRVSACTASKTMCTWYDNFSSHSSFRKSRRWGKCRDAIGTRGEKEQNKERCSNFAEIAQALASSGCRSNPNHNPLNHLQRSSKCSWDTALIPINWVKLSWRRNMEGNKAPMLKIQAINVVHWSIMHVLYVPWRNVQSCRKTLFDPG